MQSARKADGFVHSFLQPITYRDVKHQITTSGSAALRQYRAFPLLRFQTHSILWRGASAEPLCQGQIRRADAAEEPSVLSTTLAGQPGRSAGVPGTFGCDLSRSGTQRQAT